MTSKNAPQSPYEIERAEIGRRHVARFRNAAIFQLVALLAVVVITGFGNNFDLLLPVLIPVALLCGALTFFLTYAHKKNLDRLDEKYGRA